VGKPDEVHELPNGAREEIRYRRTSGRDGGISRIIKVVGADGLTDEVWHEVTDLQGNVIHRHSIFKREVADGGAC
jgi:hypothetical protein